MWSPKIVIVGTMLTLWMVLNTFIFDSIGLALFAMALICGAVHYFKFPQLPDHKIGDSILELFDFKKNSPRSHVVFHKAGAFHAPENTIEAIKTAMEMGIKSVEIDVDFTKDGYGVVIHGPTVDETTDGTGLVSNMSFAQLQELNAAAKRTDKEKWGKVKVPTLKSVLKMCVDNEMVVFIDCKSSPQLTSELIYKLYQDIPALYRLGIVCSFYPHIIYSVRQRDSNIVTALTHRNQILSTLGDGSDRNKEWWKRLIAPFLDLVLSWAHCSVFWYFCGNSFFLCHKDNICQDNKDFWEKLGVRLVAWTVNDPIEKDFLIKKLQIPVISDGFIEQTQK